MKLFILISLCSLGSIVESNADILTPTTNNYTVTQQGVTCVVFRSGLQLHIPYSQDSMNQTFKANLQNPTLVQGTCSGDVNTLNIRFDNAWGVSFTFSNTSAKTYSLKSIGLTYVVNGTNFPITSANNAGTPKMQTTILPNATDAAPHGGSYQCTGETILSLKDGVSLHLFDLQYRAFGKTNFTSFSSISVQSCLRSTPMPDPNTAVAVGVGIALGAMMVVTVVLYVIVSKARGL